MDKEGEKDENWGGWEGLHGKIWTKADFTGRSQRYEEGDYKLAVRQSSEAGRWTWHVLLGVSWRSP